MIILDPKTKKTVNIYCKHLLKEFGFVFSVLGTKVRASCILGKHSTTSCTPSSGGS
jgi:hypothetical protein